jgi:phosphate starvation-inducible protein PhoH
LGALLKAERSQAAKDVAASQGILVDLFGRMESFFRRLEIYTGVPLTSTMTDKMVEITVEVLDILATATKEIKQSRASQCALHQTLLKTHIEFRKVCEEGGGTDRSGGWDEET